MSKTSLGHGSPLEWRRNPGPGEREVSLRSDLAERDLIVVQAEFQYKAHVVVTNGAQSSCGARRPMFGQYVKC